MGSDRAKLARRILEDLAKGNSVSFHDAIQLRNWAVRPEDALLTLAEIAEGILDQEENRNADAAEGS
jgi:hypothetical protein